MTHENPEAFDRIRKAVEARDRFLQDHPELQPLQDEITRLMREMGSPHNRMVLLDTLLREKVLELQRTLVELREAFLRILPPGVDSATGEDGPPLLSEVRPEQPAQGSGGPSGAEPAGDTASTPADAPTRILGPGTAWPVPDGLTGRDRPDRPARPQPHTRRVEDGPDTSPAGDPPGP